MRFARRLGGSLLLVCLAGSCDSTQPLQVEVQTLDIELLAVDGQARLVDAWDFFEDNDMDNQPDNGTFLFCQRVTSGTILTTPISVPWNFSVEVSILRAGESVAERLTSTSALSPTFNKAKYDTILVRGSTSARPNNVPPATGNPPLWVEINGRFFRFVVRGRLTSVNRDVIASTSNPLTTMSPSTYGYMSGLCSISDPGPASIDTVPQPYSLEIRKGDTVIVEARKSLFPPAGIVDNMLNSLILREPAITGRMFLDGNRIEVEGSQTSGGQTDPGSGISIRFTAR